MCLAQINVPYDVIRCRDKSGASHKKKIGNFHNNIPVALQRATADRVSSVSASKHSEIPGWDEYMKEYHSTAT